MHISSVFTGGECNVTKKRVAAAAAARLVLPSHSVVQAGYAIRPVREVRGNELHLPHDLRVRRLSYLLYLRCHVCGRRKDWIVEVELDVSICQLIDTATPKAVASLQICPNKVRRHRAFINLKDGRSRIAWRIAQERINAFRP